MRPTSLWFGAAILTIVGGAGCSDSDGILETSEFGDPIYGPTTIVTDTLSTAPHGAVGRLLRSGGGFCSAVAVSRTTVVTARHCTCNDPTFPTNIAFCLPQQSAAPGGCMNGSAGGFLSSATQIFNHPWVFDVCNPDVDVDDGSTEKAIADISVLRLGTPIPVSVLPTIPDVVFPYADPMTLNAEFYQSGFGGTSLDSTTGAGTRRFGRCGDNIG